MTFRDDLDHEKLAEAALAILSLSSWDEEYEARAWKGLDWNLMNLLHDKGWIQDPVGKQKSVVLTEQGITLAATYLEKHFGKKADDAPLMGYQLAVMTPRLESTNPTLESEGVSSITL